MKNSKQLKDQEPENKLFTARNNQASIAFISEQPRFSAEASKKTRQENLLRPGPGHYDTDIVLGQM